MCEQELWWQQQARNPLFVKVGDEIMGFYEHKSTDNKYHVLKACELLDDKGKVITRAIQKGYEFVE